MFSIGSSEWPGLSKLVEEAGEVGQVIGKLMGTSGEIHHWDGSNLKECLEEEIADVIAAVLFVSKHNPLDNDRIDLRVQKKLALFEKWHAAGQVGTRLRSCKGKGCVVVLPDSHPFTVCDLCWDKEQAK